MKYTRENGLPDANRTLIIDSALDIIIVPAYDLYTMELWYEKKYHDIYSEDEVKFYIRDNEIILECDEKYYKKDKIDGINIQMYARTGESSEK